MNFNDHSRLRGTHATLSPSNYHWINYSPEKMREVYLNRLAVERGTQMHELAESMIRMGVPAQRSKHTFNMYVNDAIKFNLQPEVTLLYSSNCYGHADAIDFRNGLLRIHDLKTGVTPAHMEQLEIYAALFCLEYGIDPRDIGIELRIYQSDDVLALEPDRESTLELMDKIVESDQIIEELKEANK